MRSLTERITQGDAAKRSSFASVAGSQVYQCHHSQDTTPHQRPITALAIGSDACGGRSHRATGKSGVSDRKTGDAGDAAKRSSFASVAGSQVHHAANATTAIAKQGSGSNGTKKSSKLYGIRATALKAIEQWRRGQAVVQDGSVMEAMPTAVNYATKDTLRQSDRLRHRFALRQKVESDVQVV